MKRGLAADGGNADAVAVAADAAHHAVDEVAHARRIDLTKTQRVEAGDGPRAHGEDVAQDAPHARRRPLVRLDERWMVVRLHLERGHPAVADVDDAGVLAGPLHDARPAGRKLAQVHARRLVRAVLRPHHGEDAELRVIRRAAEDLLDARVFLGGEAVRGDDGGRDAIHPRDCNRQRYVWAVLTSTDNDDCAAVAAHA